MIVIARSYGQLGNRLFLYAHLIAAACEHETTVANPCFAEYAHLFCSTEKDLWCRFPAVDTTTTAPSLRKREWLSKSVYLGTRTLSVLGLRSYPYHVVRLKGDTSCDLASDEFAATAKSSRTTLAQGWLFRSESLLQKHADTIRQHFQILPIYRHRVDEAIGQVRRHADIVIGVHIRHGDYATFMGGKYFFGVHEYAAVMKRIAHQFPDRRVAFMVCSNAQIQPNDFTGLNVYHGPGHLVEDMYSFAQCDMLLGPPSTYTAWASFYGDVPLCVLRDANQEIDVRNILGKANRAA